MDDKKGEKGRSEYFCSNCDYNTSDKTKYNRHCLTAKHKRITEELQKGEETEKKGEEILLQCCCGKNYKFRQGLYKHKQVCSVKPTDDVDTSPAISSTAFVMQLINQNKDFKDLIIQQSKQLAEQAKSKDELINKLIEREPTTINNNTTNNNNQKFNLNFFLNETCKDAMNIQEFIDNIRITFEDLLAIGNTGFVNGISDIFIKQLRDLEVEKRPIHCTDSKRDTIYLKENNAWEKDDKENKKLKDVLEKIEYKNVAALHNWCGENPDSKVNNTPQNLLRDKIFLQTLQGDERTRDKIIKNIVKEVVVSREN
jgi:hypothetical protein